MRVRVAVGVAAAAAVVLPLLACAPVAGPGACTAPYGTEPITVSHMVEHPPLSSAFACAFTGWSLATFEWLALLGRPSRWGVLLFGIAFAAMPTGALTAQWVAHTLLLGCLIAALLVATTGLATRLPPAERSRARVHRAACIVWGVAGLALIWEVYPSPSQLGLLGGFGAAACEVAAIVHLALFQLAVMTSEFKCDLLLGRCDPRPCAPAPWRAAPAQPPPQKGWSIGPWSTPLPARRPT